MKHLKTLLSYACCLSVCIASFSSFGATGAEAAAGITSDPGTRAEYESQANMEIATYNKDTKSYEVAVYPVGEKVEWNDILNIVQEVNINLTAAASNSLKALAKVAYLEAMSKFTDARFEKLTETVKAAFESLDEIDIEDLSSKITARLTKSDKTDGGAHYTGYNIFNVAGAQVDDASIKSNNNDKIEIANYSFFKSIKGVQPYNKGDNAGLSWDNPWLRNDGKTIEIDTDENHRPTDGNGKHGIHIKGWYDQSQCQENLSRMLTDPNDSANRNAHKLLCRVNTGEDAVLHYLPIGEVISIPEASVPLDDASIASNSVGKVEIKGFSTAGGGTPAIPVKVGNSIEWKPLYSAEVIVRSEYNTSTHQLVNYKKTVYIVSTTGSEPTEEQVPTPVFTATACPAEP